MYFVIFIGNYFSAINVAMVEFIYCLLKAFNYIIYWLF